MDGLTKMLLRTGDMELVRYGIATIYEKSFLGVMRIVWCKIKELDDYQSS